MVKEFDTAVFVPGRGLYVFADDLVWRYGDGRLVPDPGFPKAITAEFPGTFSRRVDAALVHLDGALYLFRGDQHIRYDTAAGRPEIGYPRPYAPEWPGIFPRRIDAALLWEPETVYVFAKDQYTSFSPARSRVRDGFPKSIAGNWPGVERGPVRAALALPTDRRILVAGGRAHSYDRRGYPRTDKLLLPFLPTAAEYAAGETGAEPPFGREALRSRRFLQSPARKDLEAVANGKLRLGRRSDPQYPAPIRSTGPVVREVQEALIELGYPLPHRANGLYDNETYQMVLAYKRKHNIRTDSGYLDGIVGPKTIRHIDASLAPSPTPPRPPPPSPPPPPPPVDSVARWTRLLGPACREGNNVVELVDGPETFRSMHAAIRTAINQEHYIYLLGWWLDLDEPLDVPAGGVACPSARGGPSTIRACFTAASAAGVQIRVMLWDQPGTKNNAEVEFVKGLANGAAIRDKHQLSLVGSQHQKILVVKGTEGLIAFCGGVDINCDRICPPGACGTSGGGGPAAASSGASGSNPGQPLHDVHCRIAGPAAMDLLRVFAKRWFSNESHARLDSAKGPLRGLTEPPPRPAGRAVVRIGETYNADATLPGGTALQLPSGTTTFRDRTVQDILLTVIGGAQRFLYIEDQYLVNLCAAEAIRRALPRLDHVTILIPPSEITDMPMRWALRKRFIAHVCGGGYPHKLRVFKLCTPSLPGCPPGYGAHTYVHAKMMIADDEVAVIGSANMNRRGWEHDAEVVAAVIGPGRDGALIARKLRMRLWAEHLCVPAAAVADPIASKTLWRAGRSHVCPYIPVAGTDPYDLSEGVIDPPMALGSAPCCRIHGPSCPGGRAPGVAPLSHERELPPSRDSRVDVASAWSAALPSARRAAAAACCPVAGPTGEWLPEQTREVPSGGFAEVETCTYEVESPFRSPADIAARTGAELGAVPYEALGGFEEDLRALLDELLADGAPPADIDAILAAVPQGNAIEDIVTAVPDAPPVPDDLASLALPPEEVT